MCFSFYFFLLFSHLVCFTFCFYLHWIFYQILAPAFCRFAVIAAVVTSDIKISTIIRKSEIRKCHHFICVVTQCKYRIHKLSARYVAIQQSKGSSPRLHQMAALFMTADVVTKGRHYIAAAFFAQVRIQYVV